LLGVVEEVVWSGVASGGDLLQDAGFGGGREDEANGGEYTAVWGLGLG
jgi:hypothetical protein